MPASDDQIRLSLAIVTDAGTRKTLEELAGVRKQIDALTKNFKAGKTDLATFNKEMEALTKQANKLDKALDEVGEKRRVDIESGNLGDPDKQGLGGRLRTLGREGRNLPSVQIPGLGIGTDAVSNLTRLAGTIGEMAGKTKFLEDTTAKLIPLLGEQGAATAALGIQAGLLLIPLAAIAIAFKLTADEAARQEEAITSLLDAQRKTRGKLNEGATTEDLQKEIDELVEARDREAGALKDNQALYDENFKSFEAQKLKLSQGGIDFVSIFSGAEQALANDLDVGTAAVTDYDAQIAELTRAIEEGETAANDAAAAEAKLAAERTKGILDQASAAGQEEAARRKALDSTEAQNQARLESIDDETAAIQAQLDVLTSSGDTSEEVTAQIEKLNGSLAGLGKEADFIKNTALEASRARDAEKKAKKDAEDAAKKAEAAQKKYSESVKNAGRTFKQAGEDIRTRLGQGLADNLTDLLRDATDIATKFQRGNLDLDIKSNRAERDALTDHLRDIEDLRDDALKSEQDAIREGDFKQLFLARQAGADALRNEQKQTQREGEDRREKLQDERSDLLTNAQRERSDRLLAYDRQNSDTRLAADRQFNEAKLSNSRALALAKENRSQELAELKAHYGQMHQITQQFYQGVQQMAAGAVPGGRRPGGANVAQVNPVAQVARLFQR